jgi:ppGpp synthetase/RelA/SpoT-type nucleotidyltranferase
MPDVGLAAPQLLAPLEQVRLELAYLRILRLHRCIQPAVRRTCTQQPRSSSIDVRRCETDQPTHGYRGGHLLIDQPAAGSRTRESRLWVIVRVRVKIVGLIIIRTD